MTKVGETKFKSIHFRDWKWNALSTKSLIHTTAKWEKNIKIVKKTSKRHCTRNTFLPWTNNRTICVSVIIRCSIILELISVNDENYLQVLWLWYAYTNRNMTYWTIENTCLMSSESVVVDWFSLFTRCILIYLTSRGLITPFTFLYRSKVNRV